jgi:hypothetical protein
LADATHTVALIGAAIGGPKAIAGKLVRLARTVGLYLDAREVRRRLDRLERQGYVQHHPTRLQIFFGGLDMLRFAIEPATRDYLDHHKISFGFQQLLRVFDDPASMIDATGFLSRRETIISHLLQVVHVNPVYDLQLLQMFPDGLDDLEAEIMAVIDHTHPQRRSIAAIVEDPAYHARLLIDVRRFRAHPHMPPPAREVYALRGDRHFAAADRTFATLAGFTAYCDRLPCNLLSLVARLRSVRKFPIEELT